MDGKVLDMSVSPRPFGFWTATALVVGTMIGAGIFVLPSQLAPLGWTGAAAWIIAALGVMAIAVIIADLTKQRPEEPSILATCGDILGLLPARVVAWTYWIATWSSAAVLAITATNYLSRLFPLLGPDPLRVGLVSTGIIAALTAINLRGARSAGRFQIVTTLLKLLPLVVVVLIVAILAVTDPATYTRSPAASFSPALLTPALTLVFYAMLGFETASMVAERVHNPARNVVRATLAGLAITIVIYLVVSMGIVFALPQEELQSSSAPVAYFVAQYWGSWAGDTVALFAAVSAIGCLNAIILLQGEIPLAMVRSGQLPNWVAPTNSRDVAVGPLLLSSALAAILIIGSATQFGASLLDFMLRLTTASSIWFYLGICAAALSIGRMRALAWGGIIFCLWALYGSGVEAGGLGMALMLLALPLHFFVLGGRAAPVPVADPG